MPAPITYPRIVNNSSINFVAPLSLFAVNGVPITDFSIFADALNPRLMLVDSSQPTGKKTIITAGVILDYLVNFQFTCSTVILDRGGVGGIGLAWVKTGNIWQPNVWHWCFQADKGITGAEYTMELEIFGVDPRPEDIGIV